jgi:hypothetical protein
MSFNNYFSIKRFSRLLKQDLLINRTKYLLTITGLGLVTYLLTYWYLDSNKDTNMINHYSMSQDYTICFVFYMMAVGVVVGTAFPDLSDKIKTENYLLSPASTFEKLLLQFMLRIGFFVPIALGLFWIAIRLAKASLIPGDSGLDPAILPYFDYSILIDKKSINRILDTWQILFLIFGFFSYGAYLLAGTTHFKRYALVKTVIVSVAVALVSISFSVVLSHIFYPRTHGFDTQLKTFYITEHLNSDHLFAVLLSLFSWPFFLVFAYFKLKEKEA